MEDILMRPFLKWAGNKFSIIERIRRVLPQGRRLIEPFAGAAAVFLNTNYENALIADSNADLINLYTLLQNEGDSFIRYCAMLFTPDNNTANIYYALRTEFNSTSDPRRKAALFLYLNRHGYNGLCRYNASGEYNVPVGRYLRPYFPAKEMQAFYIKAKGAQFFASDFRAVMAQAKPGDVIYCDPPYVPLSRTSNFTNYGAGGFGAVDQQELAELAEELSAQGIPVVISNHDTTFTAHAYRKASLTRFKVRRLISSKSTDRGKVQELLALFSAA